jgi:hypothetical protein
VSTQNLITTLKDDYFPTYGRTKLLGYVNRIQKWAFNNNCSQTVFLNTSDAIFPLPILKTTAGKLGKYYMTDTDLVDSSGNSVSILKNGYTISIRKIARLFQEASLSNTVNYSRKFYGSDFSWIGENPHWGKLLSGVTYQEIPGMSFDKSDIEGAHFVFGEDPGTTTNEIYVECYYSPVDLTSESIPLCMDSDRWFEMIVDGVNAIVEDIENGGTNRFQSFAKFWLPKWKNNMNEGEGQWKPMQIPIRECG